MDALVRAIAARETADAAARAVADAVGPGAAAPDELDVSINGVMVCRGGMIGDPREGVDLASSRKVEVVVDLKAGAHEATIWTNDLTHDYVHENSAYST